MAFTSALDTNTRCCRHNLWHDEFISRLSSRFRFSRRFLLGGLHWPSTGRLTYTVAPSREQIFVHAVILHRGAASHGAHTDSCLTSSYQDGAAFRAVVVVVPVLYAPMQTDRKEVPFQSIKRLFSLCFCSRLNDAPERRRVLSKSLRGSPQLPVREFSFSALL